MHAAVASGAIASCCKDALLLDEPFWPTAAFPCVLAQVFAKHGGGEEPPSTFCVLTATNACRSITAGQSPYRSEMMTAPLMQIAGWLLCRLG